MERKKENLLLLFIGVIVVVILFSSNFDTISGNQPFKVVKNATLGGSTCSDSDGGIVPETFGRVTGSNNRGRIFNRPDVCQSSVWLKERYCTGDRPKVTQIDCTDVLGSLGFCADGFCQINETNGTGMVYFTSSPENGASVWYKVSSGGNYRYAGETPVTVELDGNVDYLGMARKYPFYLNNAYEQFHTIGGQEITVNFLLNQSHHTGCLWNSTVGNNTCMLASGPGPLDCLPMGRPC